MENFIVRSIQVCSLIVTTIIVIGGIAVMSTMTYFHLMYVAHLSSQEALSTTFFALRMTFVIAGCCGLLTLLRKRLSI